MQRFTISLDDDLAEQFDALIAQKGYLNRSEAVRDLLRLRLGDDLLAKPARGGKTGWCIANVSYVYNHHEQAVTTRVLDLQHDHHDLVITSLHTHLDHDNCLECVVLRGPTEAVQTCADAMVALRGVRHGKIHLIALTSDTGGHRHPHGIASTHRHLKPAN